MVPSTEKAQRRTIVSNREWLSDRDLEALTGRARRTWQKDRLFGRGPRFHRLGVSVRYHVADVQAWLLSRGGGGELTPAPASQPGARGAL